MPAAVELEEPPHAASVRAVAEMILTPGKKNIRPCRNYMIAFKKNLAKQLMTAKFKVIFNLFWKCVLAVSYVGK